VDQTIGQSVTRPPPRRSAIGHKRGGKCRATGKGRRCTRWAAVKGSFTRAVAAGADLFRFSGRIGGRALKRGRYRLTGVASDAAGNRSRALRAGFQIVR
jgi:hypothetical protein